MRSNLWQTIIFTTFDLEINHSEIKTIDSLTNNRLVFENNIKVIRSQIIYPINLIQCTKSIVLTKHESVNKLQILQSTSNFHHKCRNLENNSSHGSSI